MNLSVMDPSVTDLSVMDLSVMVPCQSGLPLFAVCVDRMNDRATSMRQYRLTSRSTFTRLTNQQIDEQAGKHTDPQIHRETNKLMLDSHTPIDRKTHFIAAANSRISLTTNLREMQSS